MCYIPIFVQEILNFDKFATHLTNDEQKQLMKFLPSIDTSEAPDRCVILWLLAVVKHGEYSCLS